MCSLNSFVHKIKVDLYCPHPMIQDVLWATLDKVVEPVLKHWLASPLRAKALVTVMKHVHYEDENTQYVCIGPVNKVHLSDLSNIRS